MARSNVMATGYTNRKCPDYSSHYENAVDRLYPDKSGTHTLTREEDEAVIKEANKEYRACEGH